VYRPYMKSNLVLASAGTGKTTVGKAGDIVRKELPSP
jgi:hypothetical protein